MSSRTSNAQPKKRKRTPENSSKSEPAAKKIRSNKSIKSEKDYSIETSSNKRKSSKCTEKTNLSNYENPVEKNQSNFDSESEINSNISTANLIPTKNVKVEMLSPIRSGFADLNTKIINSKNFKMLRDLRVILDRTVVEDYFSKKLLSKKPNPQRRVKRRIRRSKTTDTPGYRRQKTLYQFFNFNLASSQNPMIDGKALLPLMPIKQEGLAFTKLISTDKIKVERVNISMKDLEMLCDVKVNLEKLQPTHVVQIRGKTILTENNSICKSDLSKDVNFYDPSVGIKTKIENEVPIDESLARIKIEDVSPTFAGSNDENSMKMEISEESFSETNFLLNEAGQSSFSTSEAERMRAVKIADAVSALSNDRLLAFYDACPDTPMEEAVPENQIVQKVSDTFYYVNSANNGSILNSSKSSWPVSDESGIFMGDDSTNFNELSGKFIASSSFNGLDLGNELPFC